VGWDEMIFLLFGDVAFGGYWWLAFICPFSTLQLIEFQYFLQL